MFVGYIDFNNRYWISSWSWHHSILLSLTWPLPPPSYGNHPEHTQTLARPSLTTYHEHMSLLCNCLSVVKPMYVRVSIASSNFVGGIISWEPTGRDMTAIFNTPEWGIELKLKWYLLRKKFSARKYDTIPYLFLCSFRFESTHT